MGSRQAQHETRRQEILEAALSLFVERGYAETKVTDIATRCGMSVGLMFHYFNSKETLYRELVSQGVDATRLPQQAGDVQPLEYFLGFARALFAHVEANPAAARMFVLMSQARRPGTPESVRELALTTDQVEVSADVIARGQREGVFREGNPLALSNAYWWSIQGVMEHVAGDPEADLPDPEWLVDIIRRH